MQTPAMFGQVHRLERLSPCSRNRIVQSEQILARQQPLGILDAQHIGRLTSKLIHKQIVCLSHARRSLHGVVSIRGHQEGQRLVQKRPRRLFAEFPELPEVLKPHKAIELPELPEIKD